MLQDHSHQTILINQLYLAKTQLSSVNLQIVTLQTKGDLTDQEKEAVQQAYDTAHNGLATAISGYINSIHVTIMYYNIKTSYFNCPINIDLQDNLKLYIQNNLIKYENSCVLCLNKGKRKEAVYVILPDINLKEWYITKCYDNEDKIWEDQDPTYEAEIQCVCHVCFEPKMLHFYGARRRGVCFIHS